MANKKPKQKNGCQKKKTQLQAPAVPYESRNLTVENSQDRSSSSGLTPPLPTLDLPNSKKFSEMREEDDQLAEPLCTNGTTLENALSAPNDAPVQRKSTRKNFGQKPHRFGNQLYVYSVQSVKNPNQLKDTDSYWKIVEHLALHI